MSKYDIGTKTSIKHIRWLLSEARREQKIYVVSRIVGILIEKGCDDVSLTQEERRALYDSLRKVRGGKKVLARWLPIGYQTARFLWLAKKVLKIRIRVTQRDRRRIKGAIRYYKTHDDIYNRRQLKSLLRTLEDIGICIRTR